MEVACGNGNVHAGTSAPSAEISPLAVARQESEDKLGGQKPEE